MIPGLRAQSGTTVERKDIAGLGGEVFLLRGLAPQSLCESLVEGAEACGFAPAPSGKDKSARRNGALSWILDSCTAADLADRARSLLPPSVLTHSGSRRPKEAGSEDSWVRRADGAPEGRYNLAEGVLNQRCRIYRYH